jgi:hypothetical protein
MRRMLGTATLHQTAGEAAMSWIAKLNQAARADAVQRRERIPWIGAVARALPGNVTSISTRAVLDLIDVRATTGNARKVAGAMRALGFIPLKSRRLEPGGWRQSTTRGWTRPFRETKHSHPTGNRSAGTAGYGDISA